MKLLKITISLFLLYSINLKTCEVTVREATPEELKGLFKSIEEGFLQGRIPQSQAIFDVFLIRNTAQRVDSSLLEQIDKSEFMKKIFSAMKEATAKK